MSVHGVSAAELSLCQSGASSLAFIMGVNCTYSAACVAELCLCHTQLFGGSTAAELRLCQSEPSSSAPPPQLRPTSRAPRLRRPAQGTSGHHWSLSQSHNCKILNQSHSLRPEPQPAVMTPGMQRSTPMGEFMVSLPNHNGSALPQCILLNGWWMQGGECFSTLICQASFGVVWL